METVVGWKQIAAYVAWSSGIPISFDAVRKMVQRDWRDSGASPRVISKPAVTTDYLDDLIARKSKRAAVGKIGPCPPLLPSTRPGPKPKAIPYKHARRRTGWTPELYAAAYKRQRGRCALCGASGMPTGAGHPNISECLVADHCHKTAKARGLLCNTCNTSLGMFKEDVSRMRRFAKNSAAYLNRADEDRSVLPLLGIV